MESNRQKKIASLIQKDLVDILQRAVSEGGVRGVIVSVTKAHVTADLSVAKIYLSIFPSSHAKSMLDDVNDNKVAIRHELAQRTRNQLRRVPELNFYIDDTLDYIEGIDRSLSREENPLDNPDLLDKRKKK